MVIPPAGRGFVSGDGDGDGEGVGVRSGPGTAPGSGTRRAFRRPFATEAAMVEAWHATRDVRAGDARRRRQALRRRKSLRASGTGAARHS